MIRWAASMVGLVLLILASFALAANVNKRDVVAFEIGELRASDWLAAYRVPLPPEDMRGTAVAPVHFLEQDGIDRMCGGKNQVVACAQIGGGPMVLPNPCQARFAGETFAALVCHEKGHTLGWSHEE